MNNGVSAAKTSYLQAFCDKVDESVMRMSEEDAALLARQLNIEDVSALRTQLCDALITRGLRMRAEKKASTFFECCNKDYILHDVLSGGINVKNLPLWRTIVPGKQGKGHDVQLEVIELVAGSMESIRLP